MKKLPLLLLATALSAALVWPFAPAQAQRKSRTQLAESAAAPSYTTAARRMEGFEQRKKLQGTSLLQNVAFRNVGPTVMSGRITDLDVNPDLPSTFYVAYASGGLWKTTSNGTDFMPLFDHEAVMTIGDIAVDWKNGETIWVGTGENNSSRSSYAGAGLYKSTDQGKSWQHMGLEETHHIGRIILHPSDPQTLWVASIGHLYTPNPDRGVYKTTDGGKTWQKTLYINENTGVIDLVIHPDNPDILYAATWERSRAAWDFKGNGKGSGIYKSTDGGANWTRLSTPESGFPTTEGVGRIGLCIYPKQPDILYAFLDNQDTRPEEKKESEPALTPVKLQKMTVDQFLALSDQDINDYLDRYNFPQELHAADLKDEVKAGKLLPYALLEFVADANNDLFDTPIKGAEVYRSYNGGKTWQKTHEGYIDNLVYTYGYYFGEIRVDASNPEKVYILGVPVLRSDDGGKNWKSISTDNTHSDHHALWINPRQSGHLVLGNDGGLNISYDDGKTYFKCNPIPVGQFYTVAVDMEKPYNIYGGLQDNGVWYGPSTYTPSPGWHQEGQYPYKSIMGGDGMQVAIDTRDNVTIYTGYQFGNYFRLNRNTGESRRITPRHQFGERPLRWNWQSPIMLSRHNQDIVYFASNRFHRSLNKGEQFNPISADLTKGGRRGNVPFGTITTIDESPLKFGLLYAGTDDGLLHVSKDGGNSWQRISDKLPQNFWVSRVVASKFVEGRVYASLNGYRNDFFEAMVYVSEDYGQNWTRLGTNLPHEPVNVVREDPENENLLYVGTDHGVYASLDRGRTFMAMFKDLPAVAVHDMVIHPRDKDLVLGTHGRSFFIAHVGHVQQLTAEVLAKALHFFPAEGTTFSDRWGGKRWSGWDGFFEPSTQLVYYAGQSGKASVKVVSEKGKVMKEWQDEAEKGLNYVAYDFSMSQAAADAHRADLDEKMKSSFKKADNGLFYLTPGKYTVEISINGATQSHPLEIKAPKERAQRKPKKKTP